MWSKFLISKILINYLSWFIDLWRVMAYDLKLTNQYESVKMIELTPLRRRGIIIPNLLLM